MMRGGGRRPAPLVASGDDSDGDTWEGAGKWEGDDDESGIPSPARGFSSDVGRVSFGQPA